jgi:hypothetical protein
MKLIMPSFVACMHGWTEERVIKSEPTHIPSQEGQKHGIEHIRNNTRCF